MHCNMIADFFSVLRLIFKHKQKDRLAGGLSVSVSPTMYQGRYQNPYRGKPWGRCVRAA
jgi:hypothetical protein